jgi:hypothetical protein
MKRQELRCLTPIQEVAKRANVPEDFVRQLVSG